MQSTANYHAASLDLPSSREHRVDDPRQALLQASLLLRGAEGADLRKTTEIAYAILPTAAGLLAGVIGAGIDVSDRQPSEPDYIDEIDKLLHAGYCIEDVVLDLAISSGCGWADFFYLSHDYAAYLTALLAVAARRFRLPELSALLPSLQAAIEHRADQFLDYDMDIDMPLLSDTVAALHNAIRAGSVADALIQANLLRSTMLAQDFSFDAPRDQNRKMQLNNLRAEMYPGGLAEDLMIRPEYKIDYLWENEYRLQYEEFYSAKQALHRLPDRDATLKQDPDADQHLLKRIQERLEEARTAVADYQRKLAAERSRMH